MYENLLGSIASNWMVIAVLIVMVALLLYKQARQAALMVLRLLAHPLLLLAVVALVYDGTRTLAGGSGLVITSLVEHWQTLAPATLDSARAFVIRNLGAATWDSMIMSTLRVPAWLALGGLGLTFGYIGRRRRAVNVFAN